MNDFNIGDEVIVARPETRSYEGFRGRITRLTGSGSLLCAHITGENGLNVTFYAHKLDKITEDESGTPVIDDWSTLCEGDLVRMERTVDTVKTTVEGRVHRAYGGDIRLVNGPHTFKWMDPNPWKATLLKRDRPIPTEVGSVIDIDFNGKTRRYLLTASTAGYPWVSTTTDKSFSLVTNSPDTVQDFANRHGFTLIAEGVK